MPILPWAVAGADPLAARPETSQRTQMSADEFKLVGEAKRNLEEALALKSLGQGLRGRLQSALVSLEAALNWQDGEKPTVDEG